MSAQTVVPGDSCSSYPTGSYMLSGGSALSGTSYILSCDGTNWVKVLEFSTDGVFRPQYTNMSECADGDSLIYDAATGGIACGAAGGGGAVTDCAVTDLVWSVASSATTNEYRTVAYGNGVFVAGSWDGSGDNVMYSTDDGLTWTSTSVSMMVGTASAYGNGTFLMIRAFSGGQDTITSTDGVTWTQHTGVLPSGADWRSVVYGDAGFIAVDGNSTSRVAISPDGITWTEVSVEADVSGGYWTDIAFGGGVYVAVRGWGYSGSGPAAMYSSDGLTWTAATGTDGKSSYAVHYGNGLFVGDGGWPDYIMTSTDGISWTFGYSGTASYVTAIANSSTGFVGSDSDNPYLSLSADGLTWTRISRLTGPGFGHSPLVYGNGVFVLVDGNSGDVLRGVCP